MAGAASMDKENTTFGALYCTPHIRVPGILCLHPWGVSFEPDIRHPEVRELGADEYRVVVQLRDLVECTAVAMPGDDESDSILFYLQLYVRTLDGAHFCDPQDMENSWCLVFWLHRREHLHEAARLLLDQLDDFRKSYQNGSTLSPQAKKTFIPFPCLDRASEFDAISRKKEMRALCEAKCMQESAETNHAGGRPPSQVFGVPIHCDISEPTLLTEELAECLFEYLPVSVRLPGSSQWVLAYSPKAHGVSLHTFYRNVEKCRRTLVLIADTQGFVFGGFTPETWRPAHHFYGSGEAFVFTFGRMGVNPQARLFPSTTKNRCFMFSDAHSFAMGSSSTGKHALAVCNDMLHGFSASSMTFGNPMLSSAEEFIIKDLEVWSFEEMGQ